MLAKTWGTCRLGASARVLPLMLACVILLLPVSVIAGEDAIESGWTLTLPEHAFGPNKLLAIDKDAQQLYLLKQHSPLRVENSFSCATGQVPGDKFREGDLKTPEGVYFVQRKLTRGLDYALYGDIAYTLNFPNPVDRIRGKTGYGIWIHGRGQSVVPRETKGCVAMNTPELHTLEDQVERGMPVVIARKLHWPVDQELRAAQAAQVVERLNGWVRSWRSMSDEFFEYYDPDRFALAEGEGFDGFREHKKSIFDSKDWIAVMVSDTMALPGPDYWVTSFGQFYMAPGFISKTTKRLYWQQGEDGEWRIVGREYAKAPGGLEQAFMDTVREQVRETLAGWETAWREADVESYAAYYTPKAVQQNRRGLTDIRAHKSDLWSSDPPSRLRMSGMTLALHDRGVMVRQMQEYESAGGYADRGYKTLVLQPHGESWKIAEEYWSEAP